MRWRLGLLADYRLVIARLGHRADGRRLVDRAARIRRGDPAWIGRRRQRWGQSRHGLGGLHIRYRGTLRASQRPDHQTDWQSERISDRFHPPSSKPAKSTSEQRLISNPGRMTIIPEIRIAIPRRSAADGTRSPECPFRGLVTSPIRVASDVQERAIQDAVIPCAIRPERYDCLNMWATISGDGK